MTNAIDPVQELPTPASPAATGGCLNCGAMPAGPWCQECGQKSEVRSR